jgi:3-hydroxymyristoyl/3-hydroxydecanoyl-(acyl carrier protein) dehydratase
MAEPRPEGISQRDLESWEDLSRFRYISPEEVTRVLEQFGYGPEKRFVDALYVRTDGEGGVGVLEVTEKHCQDHFVDKPIFRGADQIEAAAQTLLLLGVYAQGVPEGYGPLFAGLRDTPFEKPVVPGAVLNIYVVLAENSSRNVFAGKAVIKSGEVEIAKIDGLSGAMLPLPVRDRLLARSVKEQQRVASRFQIQR